MQTTYTLDQVKNLLGENHVAWILSQPDPCKVATQRACTAWFANFLETCDAYQALALITRK